VLFDLQTGRRRRVVQVVFGTLAAVFAISFVFFGVGSGTGVGGIGDLFGGGGGDAPDNPFKEDIEAQEQKLVVNPNDTVALAELVQLHYSAGVQSVDENGALTSDGEQELQLSADAWNKYVKVSKGNIDPGVALIAYQTFDALAATAFNEARTATTGPDALTSVSAAVANWQAAAETQRVLIVKQPTSANYTRLAYYLYLAGDKGGGDQAATQAQGAQGGNAEETQTQLKDVEQLGTQLQTAIAELTKEQQASGGATGGGATGDNPLGGLGGGLSSGGGL
jgi:hypothetical protein